MRAPACKGGPLHDGFKTSHYTELGGPPTNRHYSNTLRGGNRDFHMGEKFLTSNEAFYGRTQPSDMHRGKDRSAPPASRSISRPGSAMSTAGRGALERMSVTDAISTAISMGAPTFNRGDHMGCYDIYSRTAQSLMGRQTLANTDRMLLQDGMRSAQMVN
mmetsp:Transcript_43272/g.85715  ORF Transcript_43272/g.85715 Transcript_43272/m.85715 type:complete len:160 (+) Transcript_43272:75-554(+)